MLIGLLKGKLERYFSTPPGELEDLLTSVVFGTCSYLEPGQALIPFLGDARKPGGGRLAEHLTGVRSATLEFWPRWGTASAYVEPEVVIKLVRDDGSPCWVLVESKLNAGKSSFATEDDEVTDQLGRNWLEFERRALMAGAERLALVYVTRASLMPIPELEATQSELRAKVPDFKGVPLYWLPWSSFPAMVTADDRVLREVRDVLKTIFGIVDNRYGAWPEAPRSLPAYTFPRTARPSGLESETVTDAMNMVRAFDYVRDVYRNTTNLLNAAGDLLIARKLVPYPRDWRPFSASRPSLDSPESWIPNHAVRQFHQLGREGREAFTIGVAFRDLDPAHGGPIVVASWMPLSETPDDVYWIALLQSYHGTSAADGVVRLLDVRSDPRAAAFIQRILGADTMLSVALPLLSVTDERVLEQLLIVPLLDAHAEAMRAGPVVEAV